MKANGSVRTADISTRENRLRLCALSAAMRRGIFCHMHMLHIREKEDNQKRYTQTGKNHLLTE